MGLRRRGYLAEAKKVNKGVVKRALAKAGIKAEISGSGNDTEVEVSGKDHKKAMKVLDALYAPKKGEKRTVAWGGYKTGWGGWVLRPGYQIDPHDYSSPYSKHHY